MAILCTHPAGVTEDFKLYSQLVYSHPAGAAAVRALNTPFTPPPIHTSRLPALIHSSPVRTLQMLLKTSNSIHSSSIHTLQALLLFVLLNTPFTPPLFTPLVYPRSFTALLFTLCRCC